MANLYNAQQKLLGGVDNALLGEGTHDFEVSKLRMDELIRNVESAHSQLELKPLQDAYLVATEAAAKEIAAIRSLRIDAAKKIDTSETDPAFASFDLAIANEYNRCAEEAAFWSLAMGAFTTTVLLAATGMITYVTIKHQESANSALLQHLQGKSLEASERRFRSLIRNSSDVIAVVSSDGVLKLISDACIGVWGKDVSALTGQSVYPLLDSVGGTRVASLIREATSHGRVVSTDIQIKDAFGEIRDFQVRYTNLREDPDVRGCLLTFHDTTERKRFEEQLAHNAFHDPLTSLANRALFIDRLSHRIKTLSDVPVALSVLFIDIDNFKVINDSLGHEAGDALLVAVADRLQSLVHPSDTVARLGGDEFTILLEEIISADDAVSIAERIRKSLAQPILVASREVCVSASIGIVICADCDVDAGSLLRDADSAMYVAKAHGKSGYKVFDKSMNILAMNRLDLEAELRTAILTEELFMNYQPIVDMETGEMIAVEALLRWQHPEKGIIPPLAFIPLAEETGLICQIGQWVFKECCNQLVKWQEAEGSDRKLVMNINVSGRQLQEEGFIDDIRKALEDSPVDAHQLKLEITESAMLRDLTAASDIFDQLRSLGIRVAIDDFGTGYSSISYLRQLPVDTLKIDRSFVISLGDDERADGVVQAMITMARTLGLDVTCEGIETPNQLAALRKMGCDSGQGYLFGRALAPSAIAEILAQENFSKTTESS